MINYISSDEAFRGISGDQLACIPAELFKDLSGDQLENILDEVFKKINNERIMIIKKKISYLNKRNLLYNVPVSALLGITAGLFLKKISYLEALPREILSGIFLSSASMSYFLHEKNTKNIREKLNFLR